MNQPQYIIGYLKTVNKEIHKIADEMDEGINFEGCSEMYVTEKIDSTIQALKYLRSTVKMIDNLQRKKS